MNNLIKLTSIVLLLAGASIPAVAQDSSSSSVAGAVSSVSSALSSDVSSAQDAGAKVNYGQVISAIVAGKNADLATISDSSTINVVLVSDLKANGDATALGNALDKNASASATLKANVDSNATLKAKVTDAGYTTDQVVAVLAEADGSFTVVINDQHP